VTETYQHFKAVLSAKKKAWCETDTKNKKTSM